ncbi:hypothetical protein DCC62_25475 [candidate division KSB1 bacterium]|nr:MAG: hypothetical protein DCC62_25475 [candidate division KSB1 bacterium]
MMGDCVNLLCSDGKQFTICSTVRSKDDTRNLYTSGADDLFSAIRANAEIAELRLTFILQVFMLLMHSCKERFHAKEWGEYCPPVFWPPALRFLLQEIILG